ncbi:hypothetical protein ACL02T_04260 [Pseudonocardia sp. RS010]|uniref:hypothetical protein n=1 Tax=Pseudonocardia sp. RS010 TaxID=3385979 RepID=UPI0039A062DB
MPLFAFEGLAPTVHPTAFVAPTATLVLGPAAAARGGLTPRAERWVRTNPGVYRELAQRHAKTVTPVVP